MFDAGKGFGGESVLVEVDTGHDCSPTQGLAGYLMRLVYQILTNPVLSLPLRID